VRQIPNTSTKETHMSTDPNSFLLGGGGKSARFENPGDTIKGVIAAPPELRQQTDIATGVPKTWDNGDPVYQLVVQLQTDLREDADDDGLRNLYVSGGFKRASLQKAVADAVRASKAKGLEVGGTLAVRFTGEEPPAKKGFSPAKLYAAQYQPPSAAFLDESAAKAAPEDAFAEAPF
jgi:hypothetical protein